MAIFIVLWSDSLTTKLRCLQKNAFGHTMALSTQSPKYWLLLVTFPSTQLKFIFLQCLILPAPTIQVTKLCFFSSSLIFSDKKFKRILLPLLYYPVVDPVILCLQMVYSILVVERESELSKLLRYTSHQKIFGKPYKKKSKMKMIAL